MTQKRVQYLICVALLATIVVIASFASILPTSADSPLPNLSINPTDTKPIPLSGGVPFDTILFVRVPTAVPTNPPLFNLLPAFVVQTIDFQFTRPDGSNAFSGNLITCTQVGYPGRNTVVTCTGAVPQRAMPKVYPGANTGIYLIGWVNVGDTKGVWTLTYTVAGLFQGNTITLTASIQFSVDPNCSCAPGSITYQ